MGTDEGGWAIEDDWASIGLDGRPLSGTNIRSFDRETGRWDSGWGCPPGRESEPYLTTQWTRSPKLDVWDRASRAVMRKWTSVWPIRSRSSPRSEKRGS